MKIDATIYIQLFIAIFAVALPIIIQIISRLDEKYKSESILRLFLLESELKYFLICLLLTFVTSLIFSGGFSPHFHPTSEVFRWLLYNSAALLLAISCILLSISFIILIDKTLKYLTPWNFIEYITSERFTNTTDTSIQDATRLSLLMFSIRLGGDGKLSRFIQYLKNLMIVKIIWNNSKKEFKEEHRLEASADILAHYINEVDKQNYVITLTDFIEGKFDKHRKSMFSMGEIEKAEVDYPNQLINIAKRVSRLLLDREDQGASLLHTRFYPARWILGSYRDYQLSNSGYFQLWQTLVFAVEEEMTNHLMDYWAHADQIAAYSFSEFDHTDAEDNEIESMKNAKKTFVLFHYSLGAIILYRENFQALKRMFNFTRSQPAQHYLLPNNMIEIFEGYALTRTQYFANRESPIFNFRLPETEGLRSESTSIRYISKFIALLFLRQFTLISSFFGYDPVAQPGLPEDQKTIKIWIEGLPFFKALVQELLKDKTLLKALDYNAIFETVQSDEKVTPLKYLDELDKGLKDHLERTAQSEELNPAKIQKFKDDSEAIINKGIGRLKESLGAELSLSDNESIIMEGNTVQLPKDAFIKDSLVHHTNFSTFVAASAIRNTEYEIQRSFFFKRTKNYVIDERDLLKAIDKLELDESHLIVNFHVNFEWYMQIEKNEELKSKIEALEVQEFNSHDYAFRGLYFIKKADLPFLKSIDIGDKLNKHEFITEIDPEHHIYGGVEEVSDVHANGGELSVNCSILYQLELIWKKNIKMVHFVVRREYDSSGIPQDISEIRPFEEL